MQKIPNYQNVIDAYERIKNQVKLTPILTSSSINKILNCNIFFKCENFQKVGAFKFRGASNAVLLLNNEELKNGVATHSSGNHAQALSLAAKLRGINAYIVMPNNSPKVKIEAVKSYGGKIIFCEPTLEAREKALEKVVSETGAEFIHPYNNFNIISGQGTSALELLREISDLDIVMAPVGGGGLISGTSIVCKSINKNIKVIAGEPKGAADAYQSFVARKIIPMINPKTIADGLRTSLGTLTFEIIKNNVDEIITVEENTIISAMKLIWERMKIIVEPSSAVPLAAIMENPDKFSNNKIGIILTGGNVDLQNIHF